MLDEAAAFGESVLLPLNPVGDREGCSFQDGVVTTPPGFRDAHRALVEGGWCGVAIAAEHGGSGLPEVLSVAFEEMACSANLAFATYPLLTAGAANALAAHGSPEQAAAYVPRLAAGEWSATMCLTEPHAGTDLGLLTTRAEPDADGGYRITGTKIFITAGEHDMTDQIVHLVLARLPDAPPGTARHLALHRAQVAWSAPTAAPGSETVSCAAPSSTRWASAGRPPACCTSTARGANWWASRTPEWRRCSR